jgi:hypothetical protein
VSRSAKNTFWIIACALFVLALLYTVFSFGSPIDPWRTRSVKVMGVAAIVLMASLRVWNGARFGWRAWIPGIAWVWLFGYSVFMLWNAKARHSLHDFQFHWLTPPFPLAPGSMSLQASSGAPLEIAVLALVFATGWFAARQAKRWLLLTKILVLLGVSVALFGILHKVTGATAVWWLEDRKHPVTFFAPFVYHANAGAFMNLIFPLAFAGAMPTPAGGQRGSRWTWFAAAAIIGAGILITTSKGAVLLVVVSFFLQLFAHRRRLRLMIAQGRTLGPTRRIEQFIMATIVLTGATLILLIGWQNSLNRIENFQERVSATTLLDDGRVQIAQILAKMAAPDAGGIWGYGPGTFRHLLPYFTKESGVDLPGIWLTGHNDWLQMLVEWGWIGGVAWILIGPCSIIAGVLLLRRRPALSRREAPMIRGTMIGLAVTGLHGAFDFPFQIFSITVVAMLMAGFLWGKSSGQTPSKGGSHSSRRRRATPSSELLELWKSKDLNP